MSGDKTLHCPRCDSTNAECEPQPHRHICLDCGFDGTTKVCRHWQVISPEMSSGGYGHEPPEYFCCYAIVEADNKRGALIAAVAHPDFKEWVDERRGDKMPPFKGLEATRCVCVHGVCWGCVDYCDTCVAQHDAEFLAEMNAAQEPAS